MSSIVSSGVTKGTKSQDDKEGVEVTVHDTVTELGMEHHDEETLEILQGVCKIDIKIIIRINKNK